MENFDSSYYVIMKITIANLRKRWIRIFIMFHVSDSYPHKIILSIINWYFWTSVYKTEDFASFLKLCHVVQQLSIILFVTLTLFFVTFFNNSTLFEKGELFWILSPLRLLTTIKKEFSSRLRKYLAVVTEFRRIVIKVDLISNMVNGMKPFVRKKNCHGTTFD